MLKRIGRALKTAAHRNRNTRLQQRVVNRRCRIRQRHAHREIEADGGSGGAALVVDAERCVGGPDFCKTRQWYLRTALAGDKQSRQHLGALQKFGGEFHHHAVLVKRVVDHPHLALAKGVVQRGVQIAHRDTQACCRIAVDRDGRLHAFVLLIAVDIGQLRQFGKRRAQAGLPGAQVLHRVGLQRVLVLRVGLAPTDANVLHRHQE